MLPLVIINEHFYFILLYQQLVAILGLLNCVTMNIFLDYVICHPVCGCLQKLDMNYSFDTSILLKTMESSSLVEKCPSTVSTRTGLLYYSFRYFYVKIVSLISFPK